MNPQPPKEDLKMGDLNLNSYETAPKSPKVDFKTQYIKNSNTYMTQKLLFFHS